MSTPSIMPGTSPRHAMGSAVRNGPVLVGAGGHDGTSTWRAAAAIAKRLGRDATLVSVIEPLPAGFWDADGIAPDSTGTFFEERARAKRLELARAIDPSEQGALLPIEVLAGKVPEVLARVARERNAPVLVMGIGRQRPIDRLLGAETVLRTVRHADCPVLAVAHSLTSAPTTAAVGVDFSRSSAYAAQSVASLMAAPATLHLIHVWQPSNARDENSARDDDVYRRHLPDRFLRFIQSLGLPPTIEVKTELREGRPAERLVDFAEAHRVDVIAIGRNGRRFVERLLVGGVAERVVRSAVCSVLIAPDRPLSDAPLADAPDGGSEEILARGDWKTQLDTIARRNAGRVVSLEMHDPEHGVVSQERGYILFGITYDAHEALVNIVLGETNGRRLHRSRQIAHAERIAVTRDAHGDVTELRIQHGAGETLLIVVPLSSSTPSGRKGGALSDNRSSS